jgi:hypothetical protein
MAGTGAGDRCWKCAMFVQSDRTPDVGVCAEMVGRESVEECADAIVRSDGAACEMFEEGDEGDE